MHSRLNGLRLQRLPKGLQVDSRQRWGESRSPFVPVLCLPHSHDTLAMTWFPSDLRLEPRRGMPFFDRYWWLRLLGAMLLVMFAALSFVRLIVPEIVSSHQLIQVVVAVVVVGGLLVALPLAGAGLLARSAAPARERMDLRLRALAGEQEVIPRAHLDSLTRGSSGAPPSARDKGGKISVRWHTDLADRIFSVFFILVGVVGALIAVAILAAFATFLVTGHEAGIVQPGLLMLILLALLLVEALYFLYWSVPALLGERPGVEATREGVTATSLWGWQQTVRWEDARLLEVRTLPRWGPSKATREFRLYGSQSVACWRDSERPRMNYRFLTFQPESGSAYEARQQLDALVARVRERARLVPRTFSPGLIHMLLPQSDLHNQTSMRVSHANGLRIDETYEL